MNYWLGQIIMGGWNFAPRTSALCNGQLLAISQNTALFSLLGTTFGGDGRTTFGLPDLRGRSPMHWGSGPGRTPRRLGEEGGTERVTLTTLEMPSHNHSAVMRAIEEDGNLSDGAGNVLGNSTIYHAPPADADLDASSITVGHTGGSQSHENMPPYLCVTFVIMLQGVYPSRS